MIGKLKNTKTGEIFDWYSAVPSDDGLYSHFLIWGGEKFKWLWVTSDMYEPVNEKCINCKCLTCKSQGVSCLNMPGQKGCDACKNLGMSVVLGCPHYKRNEVIT